MQLLSLLVRNFHNYSSTSLEFDKQFICFTGPNGAGKTTLLDAIHYLCLCKSHFNPIDSQHIRYREKAFLLEGLFKSDEHKDKVTCKVAEGKKKEFRRNSVLYDKLSDHIGLLPAVFIAPDDAVLILGGSEERRKFINNIAAQLDPVYLTHIQSYNKSLQQRNALLKQFSQNRSYNKRLLESYDEQLIKHGEPVHSIRKKILETFIPLFEKNYAFISGAGEKVTCFYKSQLQDKSMEQCLKDNTDRDKVMERTSSGIHKDDLEFSIDDHPLKRFGSQGQQKSFLLALKLAKYDLIIQEKNISPLLLLDDLFDKLDENRVKKLLELLLKKVTGQIFITDTHPGRIRKMLITMKVEAEEVVI